GRVDDRGRDVDLLPAQAREDEPPQLVVADAADPRSAVPESAHPDRDVRLGSGGAERHRRRMAQRPHRRRAEERHRLAERDQLAHPVTTTPALPTRWTLTGSPFATTWSTTAPGWPVLPTTPS